MNKRALGRIKDKVMETINEWFCKFNS
jgi:hypothetical protein